MKIYSVRAYGNYGGGIAFVAADDEHEARALAAEISDTIWKTRYRTPEDVSPVTGEVTGLLAGVIDHFETGE